jgi:hypothetical protein
MFCLLFLDEKTSFSINLKRKIKFLTYYKRIKWKLIYKYIDEIFSALTHNIKKVIAQKGRKIF